MKKILVIHFYEVNDSNLWKDNGGIPYCLAKYHGYYSAFAYLDKFKISHNKEYESYVKLSKIKSGKNRISDCVYILLYIWKQAPNFDILNFYFVRSFGVLAAFIAKIRNPNIIVYCKLDLGREPFLEIIENRSFIRKIKNFLLAYLSQNIDLFTAEVKSYIPCLINLKRFNKKVKYLPNGFFDDFLGDNDLENIKKEKIILTVGRLGTKQKNTEMFINAIERLDLALLEDWKIYLVGPCEQEFLEWLELKFKESAYLKNLCIITGNIANKKELYKIYARSSVFCLSSRWESWGLVVTEAMRFGCYPIVTDCCDAFNEFIITGDNGFGEIVPVDDSKAMGKAIEKVLTGEIDYNIKGEHAKLFTKQNFNWKDITKVLDNYFNEI